MKYTVFKISTGKNAKSWSILDKIAEFSNEKDLYIFIDSVTPTEWHQYLVIDNDIFKERFEKGI